VSDSLRFVFFLHAEGNKFQSADCAVSPASLLHLDCGCGNGMDYGVKAASDTTLDLAKCM
jgi:hypothetical protein